MTNLKFPTINRETLKRAAESRTGRIAYETTVTAEAARDYDLGIITLYRVKHHDSVIAQIAYKDDTPVALYVTMSGYSSKTTKDRLNRIVRDLTSGKYMVYQQNRRIYLENATRRYELAGYEFTKIELM